MGVPPAALTCKMAGVKLDNNDSVSDDFQARREVRNI